MKANVGKKRLEKALAAIHDLLLWESEYLPDDALYGTGLTLEATLRAAEERIYSLLQEGGR